MNNNSQQVTVLLKEWKQGRADAFDELYPFVLSELKRRASVYLKSERRNHTLQTTALVNEAYVKLVDKEDLRFEDRNHFFAVAATAMRCILVDYARARRRKKRGGKNQDLPLEEARYISVNQTSVDLVALDEALTELSQFDSRLAKVVELKYFGGMTNDETGNVMGLSNATIRRDWTTAKAWLHQRLSEPT